MATKFTVEHVLNITPEGFWTKIQPSEAFYQALYIDHLGYEYELLECDLAAGTRKARIKPTADAPKVIRDALGERFAFIEDGRFDAAAGRYDFEIIPNTFTDKVRTTATQTMVPHGSDQCVRTVHFEIDAKLLGLGTILEKFIAATTRASYGDSAQFTNDFIAKLG
ncbi:MAG: DUF2505 family protein [Myxococcales bacterium]|nr:DUF2505 family protein [Myxococcales bacterium]MCB9628633.1 DUF2505 family protein [Sandaracinaceae bacterium]